MDATQKNLGKIVKALTKVNEKAHDAYLYAREIDLALQRTPGISERFREQLSKIHGNKEIPEIALVNAQFEDLQNLISEISFTRLTLP